MHGDYPAGDVCCLNLICKPDFHRTIGRERRERLSQLAWCAEGCFDSRRRVNSTVRRRLFWEENMAIESSPRIVSTTVLGLR